MTSKITRWKNVFKKGNNNATATDEQNALNAPATYAGGERTSATNESVKSTAGATTDATTTASTGNSAGINTDSKQTNNLTAGTVTNAQGSVPATQAATTTVTAGGTQPFKGTGAYTYSYKPATLPGTPGWLLPSDRTRPSNIAVQIMGYRRQYRSQGIALFAKNWLEPTLNKIVSLLREQGYTVAQSVVYSGDGYGYGNYMFDVSKDGVVSDVLHVAHYDTVDRDTGFAETRWAHGAPTVENMNQRTRKKVSVKDGVAYLNTLRAENDQVGCLGADDGAGLAVMLNLMLNGVLGGYCFTTGEEVGGIGADTVATGAVSFLKQYKIAIEIDRKGETDMVYEQGVGECASKEFAQWLCDTLGMGHKPSDKGSYTDVATFAGVIPENVNIASGYINAHSANEQVNLVYLDKLADALRSVDWSKAVVKRKAGEFNLKTYYYDDFGKYPYGGNYYGYGNNRAVATGYSCSNTVETLDDTEEPVPDSLVLLFTAELDFMRYCLEVGVSCLYDLDTACLDYFGSDYETVLDLYGVKVH